eukprot:TRINITY_DN68922_c0_g1_i1.p1 TRINITY_DN68922_c0_g1~~TRINITY_DN68922_c0_g1_i1.p1  ORF type:complete len:243 (+),score=18.30 TRINITY_DN68922_c0_g1_i1:126-854(+)
MCKWYCTSTGPSTSLACLSCGCRYCGACLHGEAGKMQSLIKCAKCGKKTTVKSNSERGAWTTVCNPPMNEGGGPRYDLDDGFANSVFTSGLRSTGARESNEAARRRTASTGSAISHGPGHFFNDKSHTSTHIHGEPERVAKGCGTHVDLIWRRPSSRGDGPTLLTTTIKENQSERSCIKSPLQSPARPVSRSSTRGRSCGLVGPERFFYDKATYTGTHIRGGPSSVPKGTGTSTDQSWKRRC